MRQEVGRDRCFFLHVSLIPYIGPSGELKTKPTQHSVQSLRAIGITPDAIVCRSDRPLTDGIKRKIANMCDVDEDAVVSAVDAAVDLRHPAGAAQRGPGRVRRAHPRPAVPRRRLDRLGPAAAARAPAGQAGHRRAGRQVRRPARRLPVGQRGAAGRRLRQRRQGAHPLGAERRLRDAGGRARAALGGRRRGARPGRLRGARHRGQGRRDHATPAVNRIPLLGLCLGLQCMVIETARNLAGIVKADSAEFDPATPDPVIATMADQQDVVAGERDMGGTMRLGPLGDRAAQGLGRGRGRTATSRRPSGTGTATRSTTPTGPRSRRPAWSSPAPRRTARWSRSPSCRARCTRSSSGTQAHPEFRSRPTRAHPLFRGFVAAAVEQADGRMLPLPA